MNLFGKLPTAALLGGLLLLLPAAAFAQSAPVPPAHPAAHAAQTPDLVEQHINDLHSQLKITAAQQPQWEQFAQVMRDNARDMNQAFQARGAKLASMNAADNMESYAQLTAQHAQDMQKLANAFQTLYASMSDSQKATADSVFRAHAGDAGRPHA